VLAPLRAGRPGAYRPYDWYAGRFADRTVQVPVTDVLVLDGVTSARRAVADELSLAVWLAMPFDRSVARAVARDGEAARAELEGWHRREAAHFAADATAERADLVVDGAPTRPHDPATEFVAVRAPASLGGG
jgi:uridine kinase